MSSYHRQQHVLLPFSEHGELCIFSLHPRDFTLQSVLCRKTMVWSMAWMKMNKWRIETVTYLAPGVRYQHPLCNFHCISPGCPGSGVCLSLGCRLVLPPHSVGYRFPTRWFACCCLGLSLSHPDGPTHHWALPGIQTRGRYHRLWSGWSGAGSLSTSVWETRLRPAHLWNKRKPISYRQWPRK